MKQLLLILLIFVGFSCNNSSTRTDAALIKTLSKAITVLEEKNAEHFKKLESKFKTDTMDIEVKKLYQQFSKIQHAKTKFKEEVLKEEEGKLKAISILFVEDCFTQLNHEEKEKIGKAFDQSLLLNIASIEELDRKDIIRTRYELMLEAEEMVREIQLILLKDLNVRKPSFDWEYYWEK